MVNTYTKLNTGRPVPEFCLKDQNENDICLNDYPDKWKIVYFYPKDNTSVCTNEAKEFNNNLFKITSLNAVVIGISPDSIESHAEFAKMYELNFPLLSDKGHEIALKYGVWKKQQIDGKTIEGNARTTFLLDPENNIKYIWENVDVEGHIAEVTKIIEEYGDPKPSDKK